MEDMESSGLSSVEEIRQSQKDKVKLYIVLSLMLIAVIGGAVLATIVYGWWGLFFWLFGSGIILTIAIQSNNVRYK